MFFRTLTGVVVAAVAAGSAHALTVYRVTTPDGRTVYQDQPPRAGTAARVEKRRIDPNQNVYSANVAPVARGTGPAGGSGQGVGGSAELRAQLERIDQLVGQALANAASGPQIIVNNGGGGGLPFGTTAVANNTGTGTGSGTFNDTGNTFNSGNASTFNNTTGTATGAGSVFAPNNTVSPSGVTSGGTSDPDTVSSQSTSGAQSGTGFADNTTFVGPGAVPFGNPTGNLNGGSGTSHFGTSSGTTGTAGSGGGNTSGAFGSGSSSAFGHSGSSFGNSSFDNRPSMFNNGSSFGGTGANGAASPGTRPR